ncbi:YXWGXW repeat-containing protein [bacterium]|nr:YXWGXW repeat-containing protein [bacterium]
MRLFKIILVVITFALLGACAAHTVYVRRPPPPLIVEVKPLPPYPRAVWISGHWRWDHRHRRYVWVAGHWRKAPPGRVWVNGFWEKTPQGWIWVKGYWR